MAEFIVTTTKINRSKVNGKRHCERVKVNYNINIKFIGTEAQLGYGYSHTTSHCDIIDPYSAIKHEVYDIHHVVHPKEGDIWIHSKSGRTFVIGKPEGFINYTAPILENNIKVGTVRFEEYYKD